MLFPEISKQNDLFSGIHNTAGNAIKQAYICHAPIKAIKTGDLVFFYRTKDDMAVTTYGIVEKFVIESESDKIYQWVAKRTVYTIDDIESMAGKDVKIILFRLIDHIVNPVTFSNLNDLGIINGPIQSIITINRKNTKTLLEAAKINDCVIPD